MEEVDLVTRHMRRVGTESLGKKLTKIGGKNLKRLQCIESIEIGKMQWRELDERIEKMIKKKDYTWNKKESNMSKEEWDKQRDWVFSFIGEIIEKRVLH
jgi:hypothetical protein